MTITEVSGKFYQGSQGQAVEIRGGNNFAVTKSKDGELYAAAIQERDRPSIWGHEGSARQESRREAVGWFQLFDSASGLVAS